MINWKTTIGLTLLMIASIELLKIKDHYLPAQIPSGQLFSMSAFLATVIIATVLLVMGVRRSQRG
jgi:hypothetical protein